MVSFQNGVLSMRGSRGGDMNNGNFLGQQKDFVWSNEKIVFMAYKKTGAMALRLSGGRQLLQIKSLYIYIYASISWPRFGIMAAIWQHNVQAAFAGQLAAPTFEALPRPVYVGGTPADLGKHCCAPRARQAAQSIRTSCCATNRRGLKAPP